MELVQRANGPIQKLIPLILSVLLVLLHVQPVIPQDRDVNLVLLVSGLMEMNARSVRVLVRHVVMRQHVRVAKLEHGSKKPNA